MMIRRSFREFTYLSSCILQQDHAKQSLRRLGFVNLEYLNSRQETCIDALPVSAVPAVPITRYDTVPVPGTTALPSTIDSYGCQCHKRWHGNGRGRPDVS